MYRESIFKQVSGKKYFCEFELSKKMKVNFIYIQDEINKMVADNLLVEVGKHFSEQYSKLFKYYTTETNTEKQEATKSALLSRQFSTQKLILARKLIDSISEHHGVNTHIKTQLDFIKSTPTKIELSFHALDIKDIISVHELVIKYGANADTYVIEHNAKQRKIKNAEKKQKQAA